MEWQTIIGWLVAALSAAAAYALRNRGVLLRAAAEAALFAEKYYAGGSSAELEAAALEYKRRFWPELPDVAVVLAVRRLCAARKANVRVVQQAAQADHGGGAFR